jgi:hypothetical protein
MARRRKSSGLPAVSAWINLRIQADGSHPASHKFNDKNLVRFLYSKA